MNNKKTLLLPVIVEGKYDKIKLSGIVNAHIIPTNGFGVFKNNEKKAVLKALCKNGAVVLCDSDGGGSVIRAGLKNIIPSSLIYDLYIPQVRGKERRKKAPSAAGFLGVEGTDNAVLSAVFDKFALSHPELFATDPSDASDNAARANLPEITTALLYSLALTGQPSSSALRDKTAAQFSLPAGMSSSAFSAALNLLGVGENELRHAVNSITNTQNTPLSEEIK